MFLSVWQYWTGFQASRLLWTRTALTARSRPSIDHHGKIHTHTKKKTRTRSAIFLTDDIGKKGGWTRVHKVRQREERVERMWTSANLSNMCGQEFGRFSFRGNIVQHDNARKARSVRGYIHLHTAPSTMILTMLTTLCLTRIGPSSWTLSSSALVSWPRSAPRSWMARLSVL